MRGHLSVFLFSSHLEMEMGSWGCSGKTGCPEQLLLFPWPGRAQSQPQAWLPRPFAGSVRVRAGALQFTVSEMTTLPTSADVGVCWRLQAEKSTQPLEGPEQLVNSYSSTSKASFGSVWSRTAWAGAAPAVL